MPASSCRTRPATATAASSCRRTSRHAPMTCGGRARTHASHPWPQQRATPRTISQATPSPTACSPTRRTSSTGSWDSTPSMSACSRAPVEARPFTSSMPRTIAPAPGGGCGRLAESSTASPESAPTDAASSGTPGVPTRARIPTGAGSSNGCPTRRGSCTRSPAANRCAFAFPIAPSPRRLQADLHQLHTSSRAHVDFQHVSDPRGVELLLEELGLQWCRLLRLQAAGERAGGNIDRLGEAQGLSEVLGVAEGEFLAIEVSDGRVRLHDDARLVPVDAGHEGSLEGRDQAIRELVGVLAEVPHVAVLVLG